MAPMALLGAQGGRVGQPGIKTKQMFRWTQHQLEIEPSRPLGTAPPPLTVISQAQQGIFRVYSSQGAQLGTLMHSSPPQGKSYQI